MDKFKIELSNEELHILDNLLMFALWDIQKQFKKLGQHDYDIKEYYWLHRQKCNELREKIKQLNK